MSVAVNAEGRSAEIDQVFRYPGAMLCRDLYTWTHSRSLIRSLTSGQCKTWRRKWVCSRSYLPQFDTTRAAALRTRCSLAVVFFGEPASRPTILDAVGDERVNQCGDAVRSRHRASDTAYSCIILQGKRTLHWVRWRACPTAILEWAAVQACERHRVR